MAIVSLGKPPPAVAGARVQELGAYPVVQAHALGYHVHVRAHLFADGGDLVDKGYLCGKERVRGVLDKLGCLYVGLDELARADRDGALRDYDLVAVQVLRDGPGDLFYIAQVGGAVFLRWRAHGNEDDEGFLYGLAH